MIDIKDCNNFLVIAENVDFSAILAELDSQPELWKEDTYLRNFPQGPFGHTETVMVRFPERMQPGVDATAESVKAFLDSNDQHENVWQPALTKLPAVYAEVMKLFSFSQGTRLGRVMINKLIPGGHINRHADTPAHAEYYTRFHLVIKSKPENEFHCTDEVSWLPEGYIVAFKNQLEHEVLNRSDEPRIHIIVDIRAELYHNWKFK